MKTKEYLLACGLATIGALIAVFILMLMSLISWAIVWAVLSFGLIPVALKAIKFYQEHDCYDIDDFLQELMEYKSGSKESDSTGNKISSIDL